MITEFQEKATRGVAWLNNYWSGGRLSTLPGAILYMQYFPPGAPFHRQKKYCTPGSTALECTVHWYFYLHSKLPTVAMG